VLVRVRVRVRVRVLGLGLLLVLVLVLATLCRRPIIAVAYRAVVVTLVPDREDAEVEQVALVLRWPVHVLLLWRGPACYPYI